MTELASPISPRVDRTPGLNDEIPETDRIFGRVDQEIFESPDAIDAAVAAWKDDLPTHRVEFDRGESHYVLTRHGGLNSRIIKGRVVERTRIGERGRRRIEMIMYNTGFSQLKEYAAGGVLVRNIAGDSVLTEAEDIVNEYVAEGQSLGSSGMI